MTEIIAGTTPTIKYTFSTVSPADIETAILTVKKMGKIVLEKELKDATIDETEIYWTLSQEDTLEIGFGEVEVMLNWLDNNGIRGTGQKGYFKCVRNHINEVLS